MLKQSQHQKFFQRLSPQQIQIMKLLQVPTANLEERIKEEMEENPALEYGAEERDEFDLDANDSDAPDGEEPIELTEDASEKIDLDDFLRREDDEYGSGYSSDDGSEERSDLPIGVEKSYHDHLLDQLSMLQLGDRRQEIGEQVIGSIDDDGYLRREVPAIVDDLAFARGITTTAGEVTEILDLIRRFDPVGTGAQTLQECLLIQLRHLHPRTRPVRDAIHIIDKHYNDFIRKQYDKIMKTLDMEATPFRDAINIITRLSPRPGAAYGGVSKAEHYIVPDFFVYNNNGRLELSLNGRNAPELRISVGYMDMMKAYDRGDKKDKRQRETVSFIKQKLDAAKWFIDAMRQRQHTMLITMQAILEVQREFFLTGDESTIRPLVLKDLAARTKLDISTISRVSNSKYVQTEFGTYKLKFFFSEALHMETGDVSSREVKTILADIIANENKQEPVADDKLTELLAEKGYTLARRTVAKYREMLNIPVARMRKEV